MLLELSVLGEILLANRADKAAVPANVRLNVAEEVPVLAKDVAAEVAAVLGAAGVDWHVLQGAYTYDVCTEGG